MRAGQPFGTTSRSDHVRERGDLIPWTRLTVLGFHSRKTQMLHVGNIYLHFPLNVAIFHLM